MIYNLVRTPTSSPINPLIDKPQVHAFQYRIPISPHRFNRLILTESCWQSCRRWRLVRVIANAAHNDERDYLKQVIPLNHKYILFENGGGGGSRILFRFEWVCKLLILRWIGRWLLGLFLGWNILGKIRQFSPPNFSGHPHDIEVGFLLDLDVSLNGFVGRIAQR